MMKENCISIIIIHSLNNPDRLREILESLCHQTTSVREVIIVHTGTVNIEDQGIESYTHRLPLHYFFEPGKRASVARNKGVVASSGSIVTFLEDDCVPCNEWTAVIEHTFTERPDIHVLQGNIMFAGSPYLFRAGIHAVNQHRTTGRMFDASSGYLNTLSAKNLAIRGKLVRKFRMPFDERLDTNDDLDLYWKLQQEGISVLYAAVMKDRQFQDRSLKQLLVQWYRYGFGKAQLRKIHDDFWDTFCFILGSYRSLLSWGKREMINVWRDGFFNDALKEHQVFKAMFVYLFVLLQRITFLGGFVQGCRQQVPEYDRFITPEDLLFFLTNRCQLRCGPCFFHDGLEKFDDPFQEIDAEAVRNILKSLNGDIRTISLVGGEPFMNSEVVAICKAFAEQIHVKNVYFVTNGFDSSGITASVKEIIQTANYNLVIRVSLDGLAEIQNRIRNYPRAFENAVNTIKDLSKLAKKNPRLHVEVQTTIGSENIATLDDLAAFVAQELTVFQTFDITRAIVMSENNPDFAKNTYGPVESSMLLSSAQLEQLEQNVRSIYERYFSSDVYSEFQIEFQLLLNRLGCQQVLQQKPLIRCTAGKSFITIFQNYDVAICEMTKPIGNLAEFDFDLQRLLEERFDNRIKQFTSTCYCTNPCNICSSVLTARTC